MVSIIIPVYNGERYIDRCLGTLLEQNPTGLEVIAVNDGSRDSSSQKLHEYAARYAALRVIDQENGGAATARRRGLAEATGDFIAFLDIDDYAEPDVYLNMERLATQTNADIVFCDYIEEYPTRQNPVRNRFDKDERFPLTGAATMGYLHRRQGFFPYPWNKIYKAELLKQVRFPSGNFVGEDYNMLLQLLDMTDNIQYLDAFGYHYVLTENSASRGGYSDATLRAYTHFEEDYAYVCERHPEQKRLVTNYLITEYMAMIIAMGRNKTYNKELIRKIKGFVRKGLLGYLCASYVPLTMKGSALALTVSYRLLIALYRLIAK